MSAGTFTIFPATCQVPFQVTARPAGDWAVSRFNRATKRIERWGLYSTEPEARAAARMVNRELPEAAR